MIGNLFNGFAHVFSGFGLINQPGIRRFVVIPLAINILLFAGASWYLFSQFDSWIAALIPDFPGWLDWLETLLSWLLWPLFAIMILLVIFYSFSLLANLIAAPFNSLLAEKIEMQLTGKAIEQSSIYPTFEIIKRSIGSEISKLFYFFKWWLLLLVLSLIPGINFAAPFLWLVFGAWMLSLEYLDYPMANHNKFFREINQQALSRRSLSMGLGGGILLLTSLPLINLIAMPASVAAATRLWVNHRSDML